MGLSGALGLASNALSVFSTGIQVSGQNIANANTPGYIREELQLATAPSYGASPLILGSGVAALGVTQQVDQFLQTQILSASSDSSGSGAVNTAYTTLQAQLQAVGSNNTNLASELNSFTAALNALANQPESASLRSQAVTAGSQLTNFISTLRAGIDKQRVNDNVNVQQLVAQANTLIQNIAQLNPQVTKLESSGLLESKAGSLRDQRYQDLTQLAQIVPITYHENSDGSVNVYLGSGQDYLVLGQQSQQLQTVTSGSQQVPTLNVQLSTTHTTLTADSKLSGQLVGVLQGRDKVFGGFVQKLDNLASNLIDQFNKVYSSGQGTEGFSSVTSENAVADPTAALNQAGLAFAPANGSFQIEVTNQKTGQTTTSTINVDLQGNPGDTTLNSLAAAISGVANVSATVTPDGHLAINAASDFQIQFANDTSGALASLGINTFFTGSDSGNIGINSAVVDNPNLFAAGQGGGPADGSNALALTQFASSPIAALNGLSINDYYNATITDIGNKASAETALSTSQQDYTNSLISQQQQFSGVSLDQEAIQLMQYQQSYQASAKLVTTIDTMFKALINI